VIVTMAKRLARFTPSNNASAEKHWRFFMPHPKSMHVCGLVHFLHGYGAFSKGA
jgi:hypothetical protein